MCGTPTFMCPEMALKKDHIGGPADVWALGVILYILLTGKMPFHAAFEEDLFRKISTCKYKWPDFLTDKNNKTIELSNGAKNLVRKIFTLEQKKRPTAT
jgi:serine/threonine protein kinase